MQPDVSSKSQLFSSLKVYLNNKDRLQPIIGLGSVIECVNVGTQNREVLYLCQVCVCQLTKPDVRNHIMGSLHRLNYIKTCHPHLVSKWEENFDMSKQAWPLMMLAKMLEEKEGAGDVQLLEVEDDVYQKMATQSENEAVTWIRNFRNGHGESGTFSEATSMQIPTEPERTVSFANNQRSNSFLHYYSGAKPLIGLARIIEFRCEDDSLYSFLCHCCRIKPSKNDITNHLTSSSHIINYLMENYPDQVEVKNEDIKENCQLLQSLACKIEQEEGRGELKVVNLSESHCRQLAGKSYHWCLKMLSSGWPNTSIEKQRESFKGPYVNKTSVHLKSEKCTLMPKQGKRVRSKKMKRKKTNTVFMVNLPLSKGEILLKRSSFSADSLLESSASTSADLDPISESRIFACEFECETASFTDDHLKDGSEFQTSQPQQEFYQGDVDAREYAPEGHVTLTGFENVDDYASDAVCFNQCQDITGTEDWAAYGEWRCNRHYGSQESSSNEFHGNWNNEDLQTKSIGMFPALLHTKNWTFDNSYYRQEEGGTEQFGRSASAIKYGTGMEGSRQKRDMGVGSSPVQYHHQQPLLNPQTGSMWGYHGMSAEVASYLDAARKFMQTPSKDSLVCSGSISQELRGQCHDTDLQQLQTCSTFINHSEMWPSYQTQFTSYPVSHVDHILMPYPNHNTVPGTNPE